MTLPILNQSELLSVTKPSQYLGGERGSIIKDDKDIVLHVCLAFPDSYEVGMSHIGLQILYDLINQNQNHWAERVYTPLPDMEELLRKKGTSLASLEARRPIKEFDLVGFSLQYELCATGILTILDLSGIPFRSVDRTEEDPFIIGGGPLTYHPEPIADFIDAFLIGDGEELVPEFLAAFQRLKQKGATRDEIKEAIISIPGVYVPSFFESETDAKGIFTGMKPLRPGYPLIKRRVIATLENAPYPKNPVVPNIPAVHDRLSVEVMRGCVRGCRFCQAGYLYRPQRERKPEEIIEIVKESLRNTGYEELSLLSLSTADYCSILPLLSALKERFAENDKLAISFPSTRVDALTEELLQEVQPVRRSGFTIAPEAGTQRLRDVINKGVTEEQLMETCRNVFTLGWNSIKMYFMIGLPTETQDDLEGIVDLARKVRAIAGKGREVTVSVSTHVPKPHTPFQWAAQIDAGQTREKQEYLHRELKKARINFRYHDSKSTVLEGVMSRGDRRLGRAIERAYELGARRDAWPEEMRFDVWIQSFEECGIEPLHYLHERTEDAPFPWDHIDCDIPRRYFLKEWKRAIAARTTPDCLTLSCSVCGACDYDGQRNVLFDRERSESRLHIVDAPWHAVIARKKAQTANREQTEAVPVLNFSDESSVPEQSGGYSLRDYLKTERDSRAERKGVTNAPVVQKVRLQYQKVDRARFLGHLDLARVFFHASRRAELPIAFSRGFNPKPVMAFGPPLQLGVASLHELVDISLNEAMAADEFLTRFQNTLPQGIVAVSAENVASNARAIQALIDSQRYAAWIDENLLSKEETTLIQERATNWRALSLVVQRKTKQHEVHLIDLVSHLEFDEKRLVFDIPFNRAGTGIKPLEVIQAVSGLDSQLFNVEKVGVRMSGDQQAVKLSAPIQSCANL